MPQKRAKRKTERRNRPRAEARLSMRVEPPDTEPSAQVVTESQNISSSGVYCTSSHYLAPLSKVALTIVLPRIPGAKTAKELIKCEGIVVRCEPTSRRSEKRYELACMFSGLDEARRMLLDQFVAWRNLQALRAAAGGASPARRSARAPARAAATAVRRTARTATRRRTTR